MVVGFLIFDATFVDIIKLTKLVSVVVLITVQELGNMCIISMTNCALVDTFHGVCKCITNQGG